MTRSAADARLVALDITDREAVRSLVESEQITHVIHLAALQMPACRADPVRGSQVNVTGTINVFEAALAARDRVRSVVYASSAGVFGPAAMYPDGVVHDDSPLSPSSTMYGVFKQANEWSAKVYAATMALPSVGLRPFVVYGPGRDQGLTSGPSVAILAAATGVPFHIPYGGYNLFQFAEDVARAFVAASDTEGNGALGAQCRRHAARQSPDSSTPLSPSSRKLAHSSRPRTTSCLSRRSPMTPACSA